MSEVLHGMMVVLVFSMALCFVRLIRGPELPDRVVALDTIGVHVVALAAVYSIRMGQVIFLEVAVVAALLAFLGTVAFGRYLEQQESQ
jgi:multicomponent Na+:H+ antiporter subunit F